MVYYYSLLLFTIISITIIIIMSVCHHLDMFDYPHWFEYCHHHHYYIAG